MTKRPFILHYVMSRKCCTIYDGKSCTNPEKITIVKFPRDVTEGTRWVNSLPNKLLTDNESNKSITEKTIYLGIWEKHWPNGYSSTSVLGSNLKPADPPSILEHLLRLTYKRLRVHHYLAMLKKLAYCPKFVQKSASLLQKSPSCGTINK